MRRFILGAAMVLGLAACDGSPSDAVAPSSSANNEISAEPAFSIVCKGNAEELISTGEQGAYFRFILTVDGEKRQAYMSDLEVILGGVMYQPYTTFEGQIKALEVLTAEEARVGAISFNRLTGRFSGGFSSGDCERSDLIPIPDTSNRKF